MFFAEAKELVVSVFAGAVIEIIVAIFATGAVGLVRADVVVVAPVVDTVAAAIEFLTIRARGDTLSVFEDRASLTFATAVADQDLIGGTGTFVLAGRAGLGCDQITRARVAHNRDTLSVFEFGSSLTLAIAVADQDLIGGTGTFVLAGRAGRGWDQLARARKAAGGFAGDGQLRASIQAQIGYTRSRGTGGLNINVQVCTRSSQLGAASSRRGPRKVKRSFA